MTENKSKASLKSVFKTIIWPRRKYLFIGLFLIIISRLSGLVLPWASKYLVDDVIPSSDFELLKWLIVAVVVSVTIQSVTSFGLTQILSVEAQNLIAKLRVEVQAHIIRLPIRFFDNAKTGELVSRVMTDVEGVRNLVGTGLAQMVGGILTSLISLVLLIYISPKMTLYVLVPVVIFGVISLKAFGRIRPIFRERGKINADVTGRLTETLGGIRVIKGFNAEDQETKIFESGVNRLFLNVKSSLTATSFVTSAATFLLGLASAGIMGIGGYMIMEDQLTFGDFLAFTLLLGFMIAPILQMSNIGSQLTEAFAGLDRTQELMNIPLEADPTTRNIVLPQVKGRVAFENVYFEYESGTEIIKGVDFVAEPGTVTALVGSSGSGKTTISGLVASFLNPSKGLVTVDGQDLSKVNLNSFRRQLGVVLQDDFLFEGTIRENIMFPRPDASEELLQDAVKSAYVHQFTDHFEKGLETVIGERGVKLSGGQRQRLTIARAILADPRILILDEATSNLDAESEHFIQSSLKSLMEGRTTFVIAHRLSTIRQADQILVIEKGKIVERGRHDELININGRYYDLYNFQARI
ncbi:ABC transporter ATP-binding protein [uncultured Cyclobacterium sp.]|uniref:ABC transporter ATP-binding protein n=1 Tax=uncultured Cyclobacterium sp. TaxID=453820 RepID=UPI0030ED628B|tara:strand:- start:518015 stop:519757 length:1743 start_codon:yes stop_codon:yes gene_type:complete